MAETPKKRTRSKKWDTGGKKLPTLKELHEMADAQGTTVAKWLEEGIFTPLPKKNKG